MVKLLSARFAIVATQWFCGLCQKVSARASFNIVDYGAVRGGDILCTDAIKQAIKAAASAGAIADVVVPAGKFLSGSFSLVSSVYLRLEAGAVLLASASLPDYPPDGWDWDPAFVDTSNATNTGIVGEGTIDGQAVPLWVERYDPRYGFIPITWEGVHGCIGGECRPKLVRFTDCKNVTVTGVTFANSPDWTSLYRRCDNVEIAAVRLVGDHQWPNNDGIDVESGSRISIKNVTIDVGDDGICFSSGNTNALRRPWWPLPAAPVTDVVVRGATIRSKSSAIKFSAVHFGNLSQHNDMHSMVFEDIKIWDSSRGIGFQQRTGAGDIFNLTFVNITMETVYPTGVNWWGSGEPIWLSSVRQSSADDDELTGVVRDIRFKNIVAKSENGILLTGFSKKPMDNIHFGNVSLTIAVVGNTSCSKGVPGIKPVGCRDYRPQVPMAKAVRFCQTSGVYLEGAGSAVFSDVSVRFQGAMPYWVPADAGGYCQLDSNSTWDVHYSGQTSFMCSTASHLQFV